MNCKDISADWAAQRIKGLSLASAVKNALLPKRQPKNRKEVIKTLIDTFRYPRFGPGMMWETCAEKVTEMGGNVLMGQQVTGCDWNNEQKLWTVKFRDANGRESQIQAEHVVSSAPLRELGSALTPKLPEAAVKAADSLKYRDFITVALIVKDREQFSDNWIYIHDPNVKVGRVQNFKSWSPEMVPDPELSCYGLEYFCFKGDGLWNLTDEKLIELAKTEIEKVGLAKAVDVIDGCVVRQPKAYPIYDDEYAAHVETLKTQLETNFPTLHVVGRNGMHKYNNQDHAMMTAMLCAENILAGERIYDVWEVNQDAEYHEGGNAGEQSSVSGLRSVPAKVQYSN
jgi:protoporphyrinogen oxidase